MNSIPSNSPVSHPTYGRGIVEFSKGETTLVRFSHGIESCLTNELTVLRSAADAYTSGSLSPVSHVVLRLLGETIRSVNDAWGVFSPSRIDLYPHQLWVCRKVTEQWPARWVIADDVGLGKTIEAGLILWRLLHLGLVHRLLILCPASIVEQWQGRLLDMFDIRSAQYQPDQDSKRLNFWKLNPFVIASFHTLRQDRNGRHERMLQADPWDLIIVDEAHHLNFDEAAGMTLAHRLIKNLQEADQLKSLLFFTGTPHRGKHFGFFALMSLVRPDLFQPRKSVASQLPLLPQALIRNNKYHVTDLRGKRLFQPPEVTTVHYRYSPAEDAFYQMMTVFIASGRAYASNLDRDKGRMVMLVLIALQKLASSSVAAVRSALQKRLAKIGALSQAVQQAQRDAAETKSKLDNFADDPDSLNPIMEDEMVTLILELMENERARLGELIEAADAVTTETKIEAILDSVRQLPPDESVLFFTEYKATQALLLSSLWREFGEASATFINGDEALPKVLAPNGEWRALRENRHEAKDRFNAGAVRFLISTEAAGEGIDLQVRCSHLIHVDLPWNPMRLHQRVGRLNRIGQRDVVKVMLFQNPDTVESRIWTLLNEKLERIRRSINMVTEEPEDLHQLILGTARQGVLDSVFSEANSVSGDNLAEWFDQQTGQMGGEDAVKVVQDMVGHARHFDFANVSDRFPNLDLPDLAPFFRLALRHNRRQLSETAGLMAFKTPDPWSKTAGVKARYDDVHFDRKSLSGKRDMVLGVGNKLFDSALEQACQLPDSYTAIAKSPENTGLLVFRCYDRITGNPAQPKAIICGALYNGEEFRVLKDWQVLRLLNELADRTKSLADAEPAQETSESGDADILSRAESLAREAFPSLDLPFRQPDLELLGIITGIDHSAVDQSLTGSSI